MHSNCSGLARAVVQLGAGFHLLPLFDPGRYILRGAQAVRDDLLFDRQTVVGRDDLIGFQKRCHCASPPFFLTWPSAGKPD